MVLIACWTSHLKVGSLRPVAAVMLFPLTRNFALFSLFPEGGRGGGRVGGGGRRANAYIHDVHVHLHVLTGTFLPSGPVRVILHYGVIILNLKVQCSQFFVDPAFFKINLN